MSNGSPKDVEKGLKPGPETNEKTIIETNTTSSTARDSTSQTNAQSTTTDQTHIVFWDGPDDPESQFRREIICLHANFTRSDELAVETEDNKRVAESVIILIPR